MCVHTLTARNYQVKFETMVCLFPKLKNQITNRTQLSKDQ